LDQELVQSTTWRQATMNPIKFDIKKVLYYRVPSLMELTEKQNLDWNRINQLFAAWMFKYANIPENDTVTEEAHIYLIAIESVNGNKQALGLFTFFDRLFQELVKVLSDNEKKLIGNNIFNLLTNFDSKYLNFVGEIAVLNNLIKSNQYNLIDVETKVLNGKSIDFKLSNKRNNENVFVEVLNIHINSNKVESDENKIKKFLETRINRKYTEKTSNLLPSFKLNIVPVIWGSAKVLEIYSSFFRSNSLETPYSTEPVSFLTFTDDSGYYLHKFGRISQLFD
jgi:hypothetical protein